MSATHRWLTGLLVLLVALAVLGAALVWRTRQDRQDARVVQERYGAVLAAANAEATAFVNLRYDHAEQTVGAVADGATGTFRARYATASSHVVHVLQRHRSSMQGHVVWSGVVQVDATRATVIAATSGTVSNNRTGGTPVDRRYRLRLSLVNQHGRWLTTDIQFVGVTP